MSNTERDYPHSHATMCNVPNAGGCFTPWCNCPCHHWAPPEMSIPSTTLKEDIRALAAATATPATRRYRVVLDVAVWVTGRAVEVEIPQRWYSIAEANDAARAMLAILAFGERARVSLVRGVEGA